MERFKRGKNINNDVLSYVMVKPQSLGSTTLGYLQVEPIGNGSQSNFFSGEDLGGVNPQDFHNDLRYVNLRNLYQKHVNKEIKMIEELQKITKFYGISVIDDRLQSEHARLIEELQTILKLKL